VALLDDNSRHLFRLAPPARPRDGRGVGRNARGYLAIVSHLGVVTRLAARNGDPAAAASFAAAVGGCAK
jgi:hypothetical protein